MPHILAKLFVFIFLQYFSLFQALCVFILWFGILEYIPGLLSSFLRYNTCYWNCSLEFWLPRYSYFILFIEIQEVEITFRYLSCILKYFPADIFSSLEYKSRKNLFYSLFLALHQQQQLLWHEKSFLYYVTKCSSLYSTFPGWFCYYNQVRLFSPFF